MTSTDGKTYALIDAGSGKKLAAALSASGAGVVRFPPLQTEATILDEESQSIFTAFGNDLNNFDWLIFTDIFAVDYFLQMLETSGTDFFELDALNVCALGEAVADSLRFASLHADVIPNFIDAEAVLAAVIDYVGKSELGKKRFLVVKRKTAGSEIEKELASAGAAHVASLEIYQSEIASADGAIPKLKALLAGGAIDEFVFGAPADLLALREFLPDLTLPEILRDIRVSATDEVTLQNLREHNLEAHYFRENFRPLI
jgi:uroporphyrinogen-III synthase